VLESKLELASVLLIGRGHTGARVVHMNERLRTDTSDPHQQ